MKLDMENGDRVSALPAAADFASLRASGKVGTPFEWGG